MGSFFDLQDPESSGRICLESIDYGILESKVPKVDQCKITLRACASGVKGNRLIVVGITL